MKISGHRQYLVNLESIAMTDIVLNMFIFFFISFSLLYTFNPFSIKKLDIKLPQASRGEAIKDKNQLNVTLTYDGLIYCENQPVTKNELMDKLSRACKNNPGLSVMINADNRIRFRNIVDVLDMVSGSGIDNLNIAVKGSTKTKE